MGRAMPDDAPAGSEADSDALRRLLDASFVIRVSHLGRRSGLPRVLETTFSWDGADKIQLSGYPGKRDWVANMGANPGVTVYTVEGAPWLAVPARARVIRSREERTPRLIAYVQRWLRLPRGQRAVIRWALRAVRLNRALGLPWWGPFYCVRRIFDAMPCVELTLEGPPVRRSAPPPPPTLPRRSGG